MKQPTQRTVKERDVALCGKPFTRLQRFLWPAEPTRGGAKFNFGVVAQRSPETPCRELFGIEGNEPRAQLTLLDDAPRRFEHGLTPDTVGGRTSDGPVPRRSVPDVQIYLISSHLGDCKAPLSAVRRIAPEQSDHGSAA